MDTDPNLLNAAFAFQEDFFACSRNRNYAEEDQQAEAEPEELPSQHQHPETEAEQLERIKAFFDTEFSRPEWNCNDTERRKWSIRKLYTFNSDRHKLERDLEAIHESDPEVDSIVINKADDAKRRKKVGTKVHLRHLPKSMTEDELLEVLSPLPPFNHLNFVSGKFMSTVMSKQVTGFCYINFEDFGDANRFVEEYALFVLRNERGQEFGGSCQFAINQRVPNFKGIKNNCSPLHDFKFDEDFLAFQASYDCINTDASPSRPSIEVMIQEIDERKKKFQELQSSPLVEFIMAGEGKTCRRLENQLELVGAFGERKFGSGSEVKIVPKEGPELFQVLPPEVGLPESTDRTPSVRILQDPVILNYPQPPQLYPPPYLPLMYAPLICTPPVPFFYPYPLVANSFPGFPRFPNPVPSLLSLEFPGNFNSNRNGLNGFNGIPPLRDSPKAENTLTVSSGRSVQSVRSRSYSKGRLEKLKKWDFKLITTESRSCKEERTLKTEETAAKDPIEETSQEKARILDESPCSKVEEKGEVSKIEPEGKTRTLLRVSKGSLAKDFRTVQTAAVKDKTEIHKKTGIQTVTSSTTSKPNKKVNGHGPPQKLAPAKQMGAPKPLLEIRLPELKEAIRRNHSRQPVFNKPCTNQRQSSSKEHAGSKSVAQNRQNGRTLEFGQNSQPERPRVVNGRQAEVKTATICPPKPVLSNPRVSSISTRPDKQPDGTSTIKRKSRIFIPTAKQKQQSAEAKPVPTRSALNITKSDPVLKVASTSTLESTEKSTGAPSIPTKSSRSYSSQRSKSNVPTTLPKLKPLLSLDVPAPLIIARSSTAKDSSKIPPKVIPREFSKPAPNDPPKNPSNTEIIKNPSQDSNKTTTTNLNEDNKSYKSVPHPRNGRMKTKTHFYEQSPFIPWWKY